MSRCCWHGAAAARSGSGATGQPPRTLLSAHPECDVIVCDDGLQHYRLRRDVEIVVLDGNRGLGNGLPIPAGPLREPAVASRSGRGRNQWRKRGAPDSPHTFAMTLDGSAFRNLLNPAFVHDAAEFQGKGVHAVAGIGNPQRFFHHLQRLGLGFTAHPFPDHHAFSTSELDFADADAIVMTEKDAIKCQRVRAREPCGCCRWTPRIDPGFGELILDRLKTPPWILSSSTYWCARCARDRSSTGRREQELVCKPCRLAYPISDDIPVMLEDEARKLPPEEEVRVIA